MNKKIRYYVHGHTGKGFVDLLDNNLEQIDHIVLLESNDKKTVTATLETIANLLKDETVEIIMSTLSKHYIDGIIVRCRSFAMLHEPLYKRHTKAKKVERITFPDAGLNDFAFEKNLHQIYDEAYNYFKKGLSIHDQLEEIYIKHMDFNKANRVIDRLLNELFAGIEKRKTKATVYERLFGTNTPDGIVYTLEELIEPIEKKIFILGRAGTGKSHLMHQVLQKCVELGIDCEVYRCSLDPKSIDMIIIRDLNVCLHDNTPPHQIEMKDPAIRVIDMFKETVDQTVEKTYGKQIDMLEKSYKEQMKLGLETLKKLKLMGG